MRTHLIALSTFAALATTGISTAETNHQAATAKSPSPGDLTATRCLTCHGDLVAGKPRLAPPFAMVKMHYQSLDEAEFVKTVSAWIKEPEKHKSKMPGAINRFGLMPPPGCSDAEAAVIAKHIFHTNFPMPGRGGKGRKSGQGGGGCGPNTSAAPKTGATCGEGCGPSVSAAPKAEGAGMTSVTAATKTEECCGPTASTAPKADDHCAPTEAVASETATAASQTEECCGPAKSDASKNVEHAATEQDATAVSAAEPAEKTAPAAPVVPKRPVPPTMMNHLRNLENDLTKFENTATADHADLAKRIEKNLNLVISSCTMEGEDHEVLHDWLMPFLKLTKEHAKSTAPAVQTKKVDEMRVGITTFHERFERAPQP